MALAAQAGHGAAVAVLLERRCNVGIPNVVGRTALHHATTRLGLSVGMSIVKQLLEAGAAADCSDLVGWTPLHAAMTYCSSRVSGDAAVRSEIAGLLVESKADVNKVTSIDSVRVAF